MAGRTRSADPSSFASETTQRTEKIIITK